MTTLCECGHERKDHYSLDFAAQPCLVDSCKCSLCRPKVKLIVKCYDCGAVIIPEQEISETLKGHLYAQMESGLHEEDLVQHGGLITRFVMCEKCWQKEIARDEEYAREEDEEVYHQLLKSGWR